MRNETRSMRGRRGSVLLLVTFSVPLLVGLAGLAIDGTLFFIVQAQLGAAIDGATLGVGRMLTGVTTDNQATDIAQAFMNANFRSSLPGLWGSKIVGSTIVSQAATADITKSVQISATANVPLLFMRILSFNAAAAGANGTATRRDARIEVILDRSGSMVNVLSTLKTAAQTFANDFTAGSDEMGLIIYSNSAQVAYPPTTTLPYSTAMPTSGACTSCGPDTHFKDSTNTDNMPNVIGRIADQNNTNMGDALALAYIELQKAHVRDLLLNPTHLDLRQNYIVLFTDGVPNTVSVYFNNPADPYNYQDAITPANNRFVLAPKAVTGCSDATRIDNGQHPIKALIESTRGTSFYQLSSLDPTNNSDTYVTAGSGSPDNTTATVPDASAYGCTMSQNPQNLAVSPYLPNLPDLTSLQSMPGTDQYGYSLGPNMETGTAGYKYSTYAGTIIYNGTPWGGYGTQPSMALRTNNPTNAATNLKTNYPTNTGNHATDVANAAKNAANSATNTANAALNASNTALNAANTTKNAAATYQWQMASWDVVDNIASAIRRDVNFANRNETLSGSAPMITTIMTVGYTGNGGTDAGLLSKIANVPNCRFNTFSCTVATQATGVYIQADNVDDIGTAFSTLMSTILRLSQ